MSQIQGLHHDGPPTEEGVAPARIDGHIEHLNYAAIQYEFYIPRQIWNLEAVRLFIERVDSVQSGATVLPHVVGVWLGDREGTRIYRKIIRSARIARDSLRQLFEDEIRRMMRDLPPANQQDAVLFTENEIFVSLSQDRARIDARRG